MSKNILWCVLLERSVGYHAMQSLLNVAGHNARKGYARLGMPYTRTDDARNSAVMAFARMAQNDDDTLVMLDCDQLYPPDVVERLVSHNVGVVGALVFRRGVPYDVCAFRRADDGNLANVPYEGQAGLQEVTIVGTGAIAIQRWVFSAMDEAGYTWPYFRLAYTGGQALQPGEDIYFGAACELADVPHYVDFDLNCPHLITQTVDIETAKLYQGGGQPGKALREVELC